MSEYSLITLMLFVWITFRFFQRIVEYQMSKESKDENEY